MYSFISAATNSSSLYKWLWEGDVVNTNTTLVIIIISTTVKYLPATTTAPIANTTLRIDCDEPIVNVSDKFPSI